MPRNGRPLGLLLALALLGTAATACTDERGDDEVRGLARSAEAQAMRAQAEQRIREAVARLTAVDGLEHARTELVDSCGRPSTGSFLFPEHPEHALSCRLTATAWFGVRSPLVEVLPRIRAAGVATWGLQDANGEDAAYAAGTVRYAVEYVRNAGRDPDGGLMPGPDLTAPGTTLTWDRPEPLPNTVAEPLPPTASGYWFRHEKTPADPPAVRSVREKYGTVLALQIGGVPGAADYYTVPRHR
ncbi:hypothetical protein ACWGB8_15540 [Kitasatospora sp. NPDC054939]